MNFTAETYFFDFENPDVSHFIENVFPDASLSEKEKAVALYYAIRDGWRYNPYRVSFRAEDYRASAIIARPDGHCLDKSILLTACLRAVGIPARLHLAKVKNHIGVERLVEKFGTNEMTPHGMVDVFLDGKWLKLSPAFNAELCVKCNVAPLEFDGESDSVFHEFDNDGGLFMEYLEDYGSFKDVPLDFIIQNMKDHYGSLLADVPLRNGVLEM